MDRREFLRDGATGASGFLILGASGCASLPKISPRGLWAVPLPDMDAYVSKMDAGMEAISGWSPIAGLTGKPSPAGASEELARKSLRTLYATAMFADLPPEGQAHPAVQERMWRMMPEMDEATSEMIRFLEVQSAEDLARVQAALRTRDNPGLELFGALDAEAARWGVSRERRLQTRLIAADSNWRLRNQPPSLVVRETLARVERFTESDLARELQEDRIASLAVAQLWDSRTKPDGSTTSRVPPDTTGTRKTAAPHRPTLVARGARLMGIGILVTGISVALTAAGAVPFIFVATVGVVLFVIGLIKLLVGALSDK